MCLGEKNNPELNMKLTKTMLFICVEDKETNNSVLLKSMKMDEKESAAKWKSVAVSLRNTANKLL